MELIFMRLDGRDGHPAGRELLAKLVPDMGKILVTPQGKPYFADERCHFSISHCQNHAFCAISNRNIGIDAEEISRSVSLNLAQKILSSNEMTRYRAASDKNATLLRFWVLKEAYAKLAGRGWGNYLRQTDFDPNDERIQIIDGCFVAVIEEENHAF